MNTSGILRFDNIAKAFGGTQALRGVSFRVARGEIVALLGENGAGKSTLIKILSGVHKADSGAITLDGAPHHGGRGDSESAVAFIHQDLGLIEWMTVTENVGLARGFSRSSFLGRVGIIDWTQCAKTAREALSLIGCDIDPDTRIQSLSRTEKSLVAIARALVDDCDFLVLDEPTASLPADEVERLFSAMRSMKARGVGMIYVSHRLDEVFRVADRIVVLRDGKLVGEERIQETTPSRLIGMIVGRSTFDAFVKDDRQPGATRVSVSGLATARAGPADFEVRRGELLGLVGLRGAGPGGYRPRAVRRDAASRRRQGRWRDSGSVVATCSPSSGRRPDGAGPGRGIDRAVADRQGESVPQPLGLWPRRLFAAAASPRSSRGNSPRRRARPQAQRPGARDRRPLRREISRKSWSDGGSPPTGGCSSPKIRPPALTLARRLKFTAS